MTFRLDRLGPIALSPSEDVETWRPASIGFATLDGVSTRGATGKLVLNVLSGSVAQFERQLLIERTMAGLAGSAS